MKGRLRGWKGRLVPGPLIGALEKLIRQKELNEILEGAFPKTGSDFADSALGYFDIHVETSGLDSLPDDRYLFVSNHPLGGLDGIALLSLLGRRWGDDNVHFLVNDMLMHVEPLRAMFLPVNKYGRQHRADAEAIEQAYAGPGQVAVFPAGLVSRLHPDGSISDLEWQKGFVAKAIRHRRKIVPVYFEALNSKSFYRLAYWRKRLGIKVNLEQALLPREMCATRGHTFRVHFGAPVDPRWLEDNFHSPKAAAAFLRKKVYDMAPPKNPRS